MSNKTAIYVRVSTDEQKDNGYSVDAQLRMLKEYCERNNYEIFDVYNDAGYSGKDLMRPAMQRLLNDIKNKKIDILLAIKVDRLTRNNYDGFWLLNYCQDYDVKIVLSLEPFDVSTANGEMIFGMNLVFGQRERKEIGARTKRAMEEMALERVHPSKAPYGYIRNKETGHLEIEPIESLVVKEIFELFTYGNSIRGIAKIMEEKDAYLRNGKWHSNRIYNILTNKIYIGTFAFGRFKRKEQDILYVDNYCTPIIDMDTWNIVQKNLEKNKHSNYGEHIHLFSGIVKCPDCGNILSSSITYKNSGKPNMKEYYHLTCKNSNCKSKGIHYNTNKIEKALSRILNELVRYMYDNDSGILVPNTNKTSELEDIDKAIEKLKLQEKKLINLYLNSSFDLETINAKNEKVKKEIDKLSKKKQELDPEDECKEYTLELLKKLEYEKDNDYFLFKKELCFAFNWNAINKETKKELIAKMISSLEIKRDSNYNIEITNIKFTDEFISKNKQEYIDYLYDILSNNCVGVIYKGLMDKNDLDNIKDDYLVMSLTKYNNNEYRESDVSLYINAAVLQFNSTGIIECPYAEDGINITDRLLLIPNKVYV